jgi:2-polyprenyl-6-methoxyphenol hydroxylase-like FAD-dependent oxidoreductase
MSGRQSRAEIAGAGFAGLTLGALLAERGWTVRIHERSDEIREVGAGIFLKNNGLVVLEELGVLTALSGHGVRLERDEMRDERGRILQRRILDGEFQTWAFPRQAVVDALHQAAVDRGAEVVTGSLVMGATPEGELLLATGEAVKADLVVGADGHRSRVRDSLRLTDRFLVLDTISTRYLVDGRELAPEPMTQEHWSGTRRVALAAAAADKTYVYMASPEEDSDGRSQPLNVEAWSSSFPHLRDEFDVLSGYEAYQANYSYVRCKTWSVGKSAVIGDAAHALAPCLGQGANLALMNARSLVSHVEAEADLGSALASWEQHMRKLTDSTQRWASWYDRLTKDWPTSLAAVRAKIIWAFGFPFLNDRMRVADTYRVVTT